MRHIHSIIILFVVLFLASCSAGPRLKAPYTIVFYNVENLFDTIKSPIKIDHEFLPNSPKAWNSERYFKKLSDLAKVISKIDTINLPVVVGLCEVENDVVLNDLAAQERLRSANYKIIWEEGPDVRGIDCAMMYNPKVFTLQSYEYIPVVDPDDADFITRDILYVKGLINKELFHFFVNHWPSRRGGADDSAPRRILAAKVLRQQVDLIFAENKQPNIIIMGDKNDEPGDMSLSDILVALPNIIVPNDQDLINLMYDEYEQNMGSYNYQGNWDMIDNIIVSGYLINKEKGLKSDLDNGFIFHRPFMEFINNNGQMSPNRTYGRSYYGGISDHFPVYLILE